MYWTDFDPARRVLTIGSEGFWTLATVLAFSTKMLAIGTATRLKHGEFAVLTDSRKFPVQSAEVIRALEMLDQKSRSITRAPRAIVVGTMLGKLQAERSLGHATSRVFTEWDEANAWLDEVWVNSLVA